MIADSSSRLDGLSCRFEVTRSLDTQSVGLLSPLRAQSL
jgi:hypothetical protein